jgi:hypothetical protein
VDVVVAAAVVIMGEETVKLGETSWVWGRGGGGGGGGEEEFVGGVEDVVNVVGGGEGAFG